MSTITVKREIVVTAGHPKQTLVLTVPEARELVALLRAELGERVSVRPDNQLPLPPLECSTVTFDDIKSVIRLRGMRCADLARHFGKEESEIRTLVSMPASGMIIGDRGWIKRLEDIP